MLNKLKKILGYSLFFGSIALGIYAGFWLCFIGGIIQIVNSFTPEGVSGLGIALGIARVFIAGTVGWITALVGGLIGAYLAQ